MTESRQPRIAPPESALVPGMAAPLPQDPRSVPIPQRPPQRFQRGIMRTHISAAQSRRVAAFLMPDTSASQPPTQQPARWSYDLDPVTGASRANYPGAIAAPNLPTPGSTTGTGNVVLATGPTIATPTITGGTITGAAIATPTITTPTINGGTIAGSTIAAPALVQGRTDGTDPAAGMVGEFRVVRVPLGSAVAMTNATLRDIASMPLGAGDWEVWGTICSNSAGGATITSAQGFIGTAPATAPATVDSMAWFQAMAATANVYMPVPRVRLSLAVAGTAYLSGIFNFASGTVGGFGAILARRMS